MFKVPEKYRLTTGPQSSTADNGNNGAFQIRHPEKSRHPFLVIASDGAGWEHVSVSIKGYTNLPPTWGEMCYIKDMFWGGQDVVMQLHPKLSEYINNHPGVLHLWRPIDQEIPQPPSILVGIR